MRGLSDKEIERYLKVSGKRKTLEDLKKWNIESAVNISARLMIFLHCEDIWTVYDVIKCSGSILSLSAGRFDPIYGELEDAVNELDEMGYVPYERGEL